MRPVICWPGGKRLLAKRIIPLIAPHHCYVEPFGGSLAVLLEKPPSKAEVINDLNGELISFYRCVRFHIDELIHELELVLNSRKEFYDFIRQPGLTDIQRAARWFIRNKMSFGGMCDHFGTSRTGGGASQSSRLNRIEGLRELNLRLNSVCIENLDWREIFDRYDAPTTFFYVDPPYIEGHQYEVGRWREPDHRELCRRLGKLKGQWVLSYDDQPLVRDLYQGHILIEITRPRGIGNNHPNMRKDFHELLILPPSRRKDLVVCGLPDSTDR